MNNKITYDEYLEKAYDIYKRKWCKDRNYDIKAVEKANKEDIEYNGEMYVCISEFEDCEFQDTDIMSELMGHEYINLDNFDNETNTYTYPDGYMHHLPITFKQPIDKNAVMFANLMQNTTGTAFLTGTDNETDLKVNARSIIGVLYSTTWKHITLVTNEDVYQIIKEFTT